MTPSGAASFSSAGVANAPGVVATVVVCQPAPHLPEVLSSLAAQDYPNLQVVVLVIGADESAMAVTSGVVAETVPSAHVRQIGGNPGFGPAANSVLRLVEGDSGFFLLMHDDVALDPGAVTAMVEEVYRSNAGIVGPKLVEWDDPRVLQVVGYDADRLGVLDSDIEPGEIDQEQHDAVRDVFVVPSACLLIRADLFRTLGGFEPTIDFHGDDVDLCWRAHASGARVVVVPAARARHVGRLRDRRPDIAHERKSDSHRVTTVAVMTGGLRLPWTLAIMLAETVVETLLLIARGRIAQAAARVSTMASMFANVSRIVARRRRVHSHRHVPDHEVFELQVKGSVRWRRWLRTRKGAVSSLGADGDRRTRRRSSVASAGYLILAALFVIGARDVITGGVARIGSFLPIPSPRSLLSDVMSGWWSQGLGATTPHPTLHLVLSIAGFVTLGHPAVVLTALTVGALPVGWWGAARLCAAIVGESDGESRDALRDRVQLVGAFAYAAIPLPYAALGTGRLPVLVGYACLPWLLHMVRMFGEIPGGTPTIDGDVSRIASPRLRVLSGLTLVMAVVLAFSPAVALMMLLCALAVLVFTAIAPGDARVTARGFGALVIAFAGAVVLNLPWVTRYLSSDGWAALVGGGGAGGRSLVSLMRFGVAPVALGGLVIALYAPVLVAPLVARDSRLVWALRAAGLTVVGVIVALVGDGGHAPFALPEAGVLLLPVAIGLAIGAATMVAVFASDVRGGRFGWRQPLSILAIAVTALGLLPAAAVAANGSYRMPSITFVDQIDELLGDRSGGDFRVLVVGDPNLVPGASRRYSDGISFSLMNNGVLDITDSTMSPSDDITKLVIPLIDALSRGATERVGRLSAPVGIRYVVVPMKGVVPVGLVEALETQLDLRRVYSPASMMVFENTQFVPVTSMLSAVAAESSTSGGVDSIARSDMSGSIGVLAGVGGAESVTQSLPEGTLHVGVPFDQHWRVSLDGVEVVSRASFGSVMAFELERAGTVTLSYRAPLWRYPIVIVQLILWAAVVVGVVQPRRRRRRGLAQPVGDLGAAVVVLAGSSIDPSPAMNAVEASPDGGSL